MERLLVFGRLIPQCGRVLIASQYFPSFSFHAIMRSLLKASCVHSEPLMGAPYHARCHDSRLWSRRSPERPLDALKCVAADRDTRCPGACGRSRPIRRHPSRLGAIVLMLVIFVSPLCALSSAAVFGAGIAPRIFGRRRSTSSRTGLCATAHGLAVSPTLVLVAAHAVILWLMAYTGALCMGPRQRACLLADADFAAWKRLAVVADDLVPAQSGPTLVALAATMGQMGLPGGLIVFAPRPLIPCTSPARQPGGSRSSPTSNLPVC